MPSKIVTWVGDIDVSQNEAGVYRFASDSPIVITSGRKVSETKPTTNGHLFPLTAAQSLAFADILADPAALAAMTTSHSVSLPVGQRGRRFVRGQSLAAMAAQVAAQAAQAAKEARAARKAAKAAATATTD